jgi:hypothetical protein
MVSHRNRRKGKIEKEEGEYRVREREREREKLIDKGENYLAYIMFLVCSETNRK